jgi:hypothetical protein
MPLLSIANWLIGCFKPADDADDEFPTLNEFNARPRRERPSTTVIDSQGIYTVASLILYC